MNKKLCIGIIGGGNMGAAIIGGIRKKYRVLVCEKDDKRRAFLKKNFRLSVNDLRVVVENSNVLILAVKPQDFDAILQELKGFITNKHLVISIAAGMTTPYIEKRLGRGVRVIRTMPNLPAQIGKGVTALCKGNSAKASDALVAKKIFDRLGATLAVKEKDINAVTAVSGSGPAYIFNFVDCFIKAAQSLGLNEKDATSLVMQTMLGSMALLVGSYDSPRTLCEKVTSKGGTTEAALKVFHQARFEETFTRALKAAKKRAKELSR